MGLEYGTVESAKFVTNVGLITSNGPWGPNIMAAEWAHHISYEPSLIAVNIHPWDATAENIIKSKEFGVNIATENQNIISSVSGRSSGKQVDKIAVLKELGVEFYKANKIKVLMVKGAALNAECKVIKQETMGDHIMFIGEVVESSVDEDAKPLLYHGGKYYKAGDRILKPDQKDLDKISKVIEKYRKD